VQLRDDGGTVPLSRGTVPAQGGTVPRHTRRPVVEDFDSSAFRQRRALCCRAATLAARCRDEEGEIMLPKLIALGAVTGLLVSCGGQAPHVGQVQEGLRCPNPDYCNTTNGTGVYFQEGGGAGIGKYQFMITHFINQQSMVQFDGRFYDPSPAGGSPPAWHTLEEAGWPYGTVTGATYRGNRYFVTNVGTWGTWPVWTLVGSDTIYVYGDALVDLALNIGFLDPDAPYTPDGKGGFNSNYDSYTLTFSSTSTESGVSANPNAVTALFKYNMQWHDGAASDAASANQYAYQAFRCFSNPLRCFYPFDSVVFQGGIDVRPVNGQAFLHPGWVTLSARYGAPATAYWWGYDPLASDENTGNSMYRFGAAIQMKRASYCGNGDFHTLAGTQINVLDDAPIESQFADDASVEAFWSPSGATCWNGRLRRAGAPSFSGSCTNASGQSIPLGPCGSIASAQYEAQFDYAFVTDGIIAGQ
jgi:hypothetical protein